MVVRLTRKLAQFIDGIDLCLRSVGEVFALPEREARILIAEGWAERVGSGEPYPVVLVVEDEQSVRQYYRAGLGSRFAVDECADGMSALAYFDRRCPDAVVLDLNLPRLHGVTLYHELRLQRLTANLPIVVVTGLDPAPELTGVMVLRKPCDVEVLAGVLDHALTVGGANARSTR